MQIHLHFVNQTGRKKEEETNYRFELRSSQSRRLNHFFFLEIVKAFPPENGNK